MKYFNFQNSNKCFRIQILEFTFFGIEIRVPFPKLGKTIWINFFLSFHGWLHICPPNMIKNKYSIRRIR